MVKSKYDKKHLRNLRTIEKQVDLLYKEAAEEAARIGVSLRDFNPSKPFSFADSTITQKKAEKLVQWLKSGLMQTITAGVHTGWALSNQKNDSIADSFFGKNVPNIIKRQYYNHNGAAEQAFLERKTNGMNLSDRVWRYSDEFKKEIELGIDLGLRTGRSADQMSRDLRIYLQHPDKLFRDVKTKMLDADDNPIWRKSYAAEADHPGRGVYRSSYKNARRLAVTETNMAYRAADHERWQQMDFILGQHVIRSTRHETDGVHDICDELSGYNEDDKKGRYPKDFKFTGWHPLCRCFVVPLLPDEDEFAEWQEKKANGESAELEGHVEGMPKEYNEWQDKNALRIVGAEKRGTLPEVLDSNSKSPSHIISQNTIEWNMPEGVKPTGFTYEDGSHDLTRIKSCLESYADANKELFPKGLPDVIEINDTNGGFMGYDRATHTLVINSAHFTMGGQTYIPFEALDEALESIYAGRGMTFMQEYSIETLWHELRHVSAVGWQDEEHTRFVAHTMDVINQYCARRTYPSFIRAINKDVKAWHYNTIVNEGLGYKESIKDLHDLLSKNNITQEELFLHFKDAILQERYEKIEGMLIEFIAEKGVMNKIDIQEEIRMWYGHTY